MSNRQSASSSSRHQRMCVVFNVLRNDGGASTVSIDSTLAERMSQLLGGYKALCARVRKLAAQFVKASDAYPTRSAYVTAGLRKVLLTHERNQRHVRISFSTPTGGCTSVALPRALADEAVSLLGSKSALNELTRNFARNFEPAVAGGLTRSEFVALEVREAVLRHKRNKSYARFNVVTENGKQTTISVSPALADSALRTLGSSSQVRGLVRRLALSYKPTSTLAPNRSAFVSSALENLVVSHRQAGHTAAKQHSA